MDLYQDLENKKKKIAVIGLGYVGVPLLVALNKYFNVIGFDTSKEKIDALYNSDDFSDIISKDELKKINCRLSSDEEAIKDVNFFIIAVPTPIDIHNNPDLSMIKDAQKLGT